MAMRSPAGRSSGTGGSHATSATRIAVAVATISMLVAACSAKSAASAPPPVGLPVPGTGEITFYLSLPGSASALHRAAVQVASPGSSQYRHFSSLSSASRQFGATDAQIDTVTKKIQSLGLQFTADPTRLFGRVTGSAQQWQTALGAPLSKQAATRSSPFTGYTLPARTPAALHPSGTSLLVTQVLVYDRTAEGHRHHSGSRPTPSAKSATAGPNPTP